MKEESDIRNGATVNLASLPPSLSQIQLTKIDVKMQVGSYKISNIKRDMKDAQCLGISSKGQFFLSSLNLTVGSLARIWIYIPNYWQKKSAHVPYSHTSAPEYFQMFSKVEHCVPDQDGYRIFCQTMNIHEIDEKILEDFIKLSGIQL